MNRYIKRRRKTEAKLIALADPMVKYRFPGDTESRSTSFTRAVQEVPLEQCDVVRNIPLYVGQDHHPGFFWSSKTGMLLPFESKLEAKWLRILDYDPTVDAFSTQPFCVYGVDGDGDWHHTPDIFVRRVDGSCDILNVTSKKRRRNPERFEQCMERMNVLCAQHGVGHEVKSDPDELMFQNVRFLSAYRRLGLSTPEASERALAACQEPTPLGELIGSLGDWMLWAPIVMHLCWWHQLEIDLCEPLAEESIVAPGLVS